MRSIRRFTDKGSSSQHRLKRPKRRRFCGNQHVSPANPDRPSTSTSATKLSSYDGIGQKFERNFRYVIMEFHSVFDNLSTLVQCKGCGSDVTFSPQRVRGLGFKLEIRCEDCQPSEIDSGPHIRNSFEINTRITFAMRQLGVGYRGLRLFCGLMDFFDYVQLSTYESIRDHMSDVAERVAVELMKKAAKEEQRLTVEAGTFQDSQSTAVSLDGSWSKRGHTSLFGLVAAIGVRTNKVIDVSVKSRHCQGCERLKSFIGTESYDEMMESHARHCTLNHQGSSAAMEADLAVDLYARSVEQRGLKYKYFIGDGDSKAFKKVLDSNPYGDGDPIIKKECVGHVQKRMGSRLRKLYMENRSLRGRGKFTMKEIEKLTSYYGNAIRRNSDSLSNMKAAVWATFYHRISTDDSPQHHLCPPGPSSWCAWQKAKFLNQEAEFTHPSAWSTELQKALKPIYEVLSQDSVLERCLGAFTQNNNESYHSVVWQLAPESRFCGERTIRMSVHIAVCTFNEGRRTLSIIMNELGCTVGEKCFKYLEESDELRVKQANRRFSQTRCPEAGTPKQSQDESRDNAMDLDDVAEGPGIDSEW